MKFLNTFLCLFLLVNVAFSQDSYARVKIFLDDTNLTSLSKLGLETDHGVHRPGKHFMNDLSESEIAILEEEGISYEILIPDVAHHYAVQNLHEHQHARKHSMTCADTSFPYVTPSNYRYGSMGGYHTYEELFATLDSMQAKYPHLISRVAPIGDIKTEEGRSIHWVKVGVNPSVDEEGKPEVLYTALHHAREPNSLAQMIFYLWYLLENYETDETIQFIVDNTELFFIPCVNPDGYIYNESTNPNGGGLWRKNRAVINDVIAGVDLNRNYGYEWAHDNTGSSANPNSNTYRGPEAFSEPETRAVRDFCLAHDFKVALNYHTFGNLLIYPWGYSDGATVDDLTFKGFAEAMTSENDYLAGTGLETIGYTVNGDSDDWMYGGEGILAMTPEVGGGEFGFWPPKSAIDQLNKSALKQNIVAALLLHQYAEVEAQQISEDKISLSVTKYSLDSNDVDLQLLSLDERLSFSENNVVVKLKHLETRDVIINLNIDLENIEGETKLPYVVTRRLGTLSLSDTFSLSIEAALEIVFEDDGSSLSQWETSSWGLSGTEFVSDSTSFGDSPDGFYENGTTATMTMKEAVDLSKATEGRLEYYAKWDIETDFDYAQVLLSRDGINYEAVCTERTALGNDFQLSGEPIYEGRQEDWVLETLDLEKHLGEELWVQFSLVSDDFQNMEGIFIDDVVVKASLEIPSSTSDETLLMTELKISPNPAQGLITVRTPAHLRKESGEYRIFNSLGMIIGTYGNHIIDVSDLTKGMYFMSVEWKDGSSASTRFLKL